MREWWERLWIRVFNFLERRRTTVELGIAALLILFNFFLLRANRDYARTARLAQRPWLDEINLRDAQSNPLPYEKLTIMPEQLLDMAVEVENFGQSPSPSYQIAYRVMLGERYPTEEAAWKVRSPVPSFDCASAIKDKYSGPLFPGDSHTHIEHQDQNDVLSLSTPTFQDVKDRRKAIYLSGCINYEDTGRHVYSSDFCLFFFHPDGNASGYFAFCPIGNELK